MPFDFRPEAAETNARFAEELARLTTLTTTEVERLFPRKTDKKRFEQLMQIVNSSASRNKRTAVVRKNFDVFGDTVVKLLEQFT